MSALILWLFLLVELIEQGALHLPGRLSFCILIVRIEVLKRAVDEVELRLDVFELFFRLHEHLIELCKKRVENILPVRNPQLLADHVVELLDAAEFRL